MDEAKRVHYHDTSQRRILTYHHFVTFMTVGLLFADLVRTLSYYFFYSPVIGVVLVSMCIGAAAGDVAGRMLYRRIDSFRRVTIAATALFVLLAVVYLSRGIVAINGRDPFLWLFFQLPWAIPLLIAMIFIVFGIVLHYLICVSCVDFIDGVEMAERFLRLLLAGLPAGMIIASCCHLFALPSYYLAPIALLIIPSGVLLQLPCRPTPVYVRVEGEEEEEQAAPSHEGKGTILGYLNVIFAILYAFLGYVAVARCYGASTEVTMIFIIAAFTMTAAGYWAGRLSGKWNLAVFGQLGFPIAFLSFLMLCVSVGDLLPFAAGVLLFSPVSLLTGAILFHTAKSLSLGRDHSARALAFEFSLIVIPTPIIIALGFITFTNFWYHAVLSLLMIANLFIPAVYAVSGRKKGRWSVVPFVVTIVVVPAYVFLLLYFQLPLNRELFAPRAGNADELKNINYDEKYIKNRARVTRDGVEIFVINDSVIRNLKRALVPIALHHRDGGRILFIDGNQRFFRNPIIGYFRDATCLDPLSERDVDYQSLPVSGTQKYISESGDILAFFARSGAEFATIVDIPNCADQDRNAFRFSLEYYRIIKSKLERNGVFAQIFNVPGCRAGLFAAALRSSRECFSKQAIYCFANVLLMVCSDSDRAFTVGRDRYGGFISFMNGYEGLDALFLNELHALSHLASLSVADFSRAVREADYKPIHLFMPKTEVMLDPAFYETWTTKHDLILSLLDRGNDELTLRLAVINDLQTSSGILTLLKKTELAEARERYRDETDLLFTLKREAEFRIPLQGYVMRMLRWKEKYYYDAAVRMEREKRWDDARNCYLAVRSINPNNFEANYRLGLLAITLQDMDAAFTYIQEAMRINANHPSALLQMGILYFSTGKYDRAIEFFNRALQQNEPVPLAYRYMGLCHERLGNIYDAERYYSRAVDVDPADVESKARLKEIRERIQKEQKKWDISERKNENEAEIDADMPLPISRGAYEIRLKDNDKSLPLIDPATGEEITTGGQGEPPSNKERRVQETQPTATPENR